MTETDRTRNRFLKLEFPRMEPPSKVREMPEKLLTEWRFARLTCTGTTRPSGGIFDHVLRV